MEGCLLRSLAQRVTFRHGDATIRGKAQLEWYTRSGKRSIVRPKVHDTSSTLRLVHADLAGNFRGKGVVFLSGERNCACRTTSTANQSQHQNQTNTARLPRTSQVQISIPLFSRHQCVAEDDQLLSIRLLLFMNRIAMAR